jgi:hypothetical protein
MHLIYGFYFLYLRIKSLISILRFSGANKTLICLRLDAFAKKAIEKHVLQLFCEAELEKYWYCTVNQEKFKDPVCYSDKAIREFHPKKLIFNSDIDESEFGIDPVIPDTTTQLRRSGRNSLSRSSSSSSSSSSP